MTSVLGIHHVTAIASDPQRNLDFYVGILGLRLVKRTVNFDDPQTYHFYYGDDVGTPGTIMTFFPWPGARRGRPGSGQVAITSFATVPGALGFWVERLVRHGIDFRGPAHRRVGDEQERVIAFRDPDGLMLEIVASDRAESRTGWTEAPGIPPEHAIRGFHGVTLWVSDDEPTIRVLESTLGFRQTGELDGVRRYEAGNGGPGTIVDVRATQDFIRGAGGAGVVHHVAWEVADDAAQLEVRRQVVSAGLHPTEVIDRNYFRSVYFREPDGILYELATRPPGFAIDEAPDSLGTGLMLPPQYEPYRARIEAVLPQIHLPAPASEPPALAPTGPERAGSDALGFVHRYLPPELGFELAGGTTLLVLHGTGGDENDMIPLGRHLLPGAGILSPRGKVSENGASRFFRRISEGVFDLEDLAVRTDELADFVAAATRSYGLDPAGIVAVGFSNGANIAVNVLLRRPGTLAGAVLLSPMLPFEPDTIPDLAGTAVFIGAGRNDRISPPEQVERLVEILRGAGADVVVHWQPGGHRVTTEELDAAREWLQRTVAGWSERRGG